MRRVTPPRFASCCVLLLPFVAGERPLAGQSERVRQLVESALANLEEPSLVADALRRLENLGAAAVPLLRAQLAWPGRRQLPTARVRHIAYVLGRLGRAGLPAADDLREVLRNDNPDVALQATWALGQMAPWFSEARRASIHADLDAASNEVRQSSQATILRFQLIISQDPSTRVLRELLAERGEVERIAACRALVAAGAAARADRAELVPIVEDQLAKVMHRGPVSWLSPSPGAYAIADLTEAWLALSQKPLDPRAARGLLASWDVDQRLRGLVWLQEHGAAVPPRERIDVVARLWDVEPLVVRAACKTLAAWGDTGLVALAPLRTMEQSHSDSTIARHAGAAADAIVAAAATWPATDRAWLQAVDDTLRGREAVAPGEAMSARGCQLLSSVLHAAQWHDADHLDKALALLERAGPCPVDAVQAVFGWLRHQDPDVVAVACAWLARRGTAVRSAVEGEFLEPFETAGRRLVTYQMNRAIPAGVELFAHLLSAGGAAADRTALVEDANLRFVARAIADGLLQPRGALGTSERRLQALVTTPIAPGVLVQIEQWDSGRTLPADLGGPVRTLAALALIDLGTAFDAPADLDAIVVEQTGQHLAELRAQGKALRETGALEELVGRLEDTCRERLGVHANLRWLPLRTAR